MSVWSCSTTIKCPPADVFDFISNYQNDWKWQIHRIEISKTEQESSVEWNLGRNIFTLGYRHLKGTHRIIDYAVNQRIISEFMLGNVRILDDRRICSAENETAQFDYLLRIEPQGIWKMFTPIFVRDLSGEIKKSLHWLKEMLETYQNVSVDHLSNNEQNMIFDRTGNLPV